MEEREKMVRSGTREKLIEVGLKQLPEKGYHGTGVKELVDAAGIPKGSFYNHFASKEAFVCEVITTYIDQMMSILDTVEEQQARKPALERIKTFHRKLAAMIAADGWRYGCLLGSLAGELATQSDACREALRNATAIWQERLTPLFAEGQNDGAMQTDVTANELAIQVWNTWQGALLRMQFERTGKSLDQVIDVMLDRIAVKH